MQSKLYNDTGVFSKKYKNRRCWHIVIVVMAAIVVFGTMYALIIPAITIDKETFCGLSEHTHSDECYNANEKTGEKQLLCELKEHVHVDNCFNKELFVEAKAMGDPNEVIASGTFSSNGSWKLTGDGKLTITGAKTVPSNASWGKYKNDITSVYIGSDITSLSSYAFDHYSNLVTVEFEEGSILKSIGDRAFQYCFSLTEITIPDSVETLGNYSFYFCRSLKSVVFEEGSILRRIGEYAFQESPITEITIPASVQTFGKQAFASCKSLKSVVFEEGSILKSIGDSAFSTCESLTEITIPASVESIGVSAFANIRKIYFETGSQLKTVGSSAFSCNYSQKIDRLSAAAILQSNSITSGNSAVTIEVNSACSELTAETLNQYIQKLYIKRVIVTPDVSKVNGDLLDALTLNKNTELFFEKGTHFTLAGDFSPHNSRYPYLRSGEYYADENSVLYRIESGKAYLTYCPAAVEKLTVPAKIAEYDVVGVDSGAFNTALNVTEVSFEAPESITTIAPYSFANAVNLEKVNGAGTEEAVKAVLTGSGEFGAYVFYNTKITGNEVSFTLNTDDLKPDDYLKIITEFKNLAPKPPQENTCYTGQSATTTISITNPKNTASNSSNYTVYFWFLKSTGSLNFAARDHILLYEIEGTDGKHECHIQVDEMEIPGLYRFSIPSLVPGATLTFDVTSFVSSPGMPGEKMLVWCEKNTQDTISQTNIVVPEKYQMIQWITHPEEFKVTSAFRSYGADFKGDADGNVSLRGGMNCYIHSDLQGSKIEGVGEDFVREIDYVTAFELSEGMHWNQKVVDAINDGQWTVEYPLQYKDDIDSTSTNYSYGRCGVIYVYIDGVKTQIGYVKGSGENDYVDVKKVYFNGDEFCVEYSCENLKSTQQNSSGIIGQEIANVSTSVQICSNVIIPDEELIESCDTNTSLIIKNKTTETVHYTHSEDKTDTCSSEISYKLRAAKLDLSKKTSNKYDQMGCYYDYVITAKNNGTFPYNDLKYIEDPLGDMFYITPDNLEKMLFNDESGKYLTVTIKNAEFCEPLTGSTAVTGTDGLPHYIEIGNTANDTPHDGMERNEPPNVGHTAHTKGNTIAITYFNGGFKITVTDNDGNIVGDYNNKQYNSDHGQIESIFDSIGFIITEKTRYIVTWAMPDDAKVLKSNESREYKIYTTIKNSFMVISEDKRKCWNENSTSTRKYSNRNYVYAFGSEGKPSPPDTYPENDSLSKEYYDQYTYCGGSRLENDASIIDGYSVNGVSISNDPNLSVSVGDVVDYSVNFSYRNYNTELLYKSYDVIPLVDRLNGAQVLLVPVKGNENCDWVNDDIEIYTDKDGTQYYILNKAGTYKNVNIGGYLADRIEVKQNPDNGGLETLIYWYMTKGYEKEVINLKAIVSPEYAGIISSGKLQMSNESWLGDHQHHHLWDTVNFEATDIKSGKKIVTSKGKTPDEDKLDDSSYLKEGEQVTYRLDIVPTGSPRLRTLNCLNIYDALPERDTDHPWKNEDILKITFVNSDGTPYTTVVKEGGESITALENGDKYSISDSYPGMTEQPKAEQKYIVWDNDFKLTLYENPVYIYVTLQMPSGSDWLEYCQAYANKELANELYVNGDCSTVYHELAIEGEAVLHKGVIGTGYCSDIYGIYDNTYYLNSGENSRIYYSNPDAFKKFVAYYVSLYNSGKSKIYIDDIVDILPKGYSYLCMIKNFYKDSDGNARILVDRYSGNDYPSLVFNNVLDIVSTDDEKYLAANMYGTSEDGKVTFNPSSPTGEYAVKYDKKIGKYYLEPNEALVFAYICDIDEAANTEDIAVNNVAMKYYDYNGAGVKLSDATVVSKNDLIYKGANAVKNDGEGYLYDYGQAEQNGFTGGDTHDKWLASNVTLKRGKIVPGIIKNVDEVKTSSGTNVSTSYAQFTDTITWEVTVTNDGDYHLQDYIITDVMQYPFRFDGDVKVSFDVSGLKSDFTLLKFIKWADDGKSVQVKTSDDSTAFTLNMDEWTPVVHDKSNLTFDMRISQDSATENFILELKMTDKKLGIPEGGRLKLKITTLKPNKEDIKMENKIYYNNVYITPTQKYDENMVTRGDTVTLNEKSSIHNVAQIFVSYGNVTTSLKEIEQTDNPENHAVSNVADQNYITVPNTDSGVTYTLKVESESAALRWLTVIDNLPQENDHETFDASSPRYSEFKVNLAENPNFRVSIDYPNGEHIDLEDNQYVLKYTDKTEFDNSDREGNGEGWYDTPKDTTRSFRIIIKEPSENSELMAANATISIRFDAKIKGNPQKGSLAWNSFGYRYNSYATSSETSYLEAAPLKVGVGTPNAPFIIKSLEDNVGNKWMAEKDSQFKFIVYKGDTIEGLNNLTDQSKIAAQLAGRDYTYFDLTVKQGESESGKIQIDKNLYSYDTDKGWVVDANKGTFKWIDGETYNVIELPIENSDYEYGSIGNVKGNSYSFVYHCNRPIDITAVNLRKSWQISILKTDNKDNPLADAVFGLYSPNKSDSLSKDNVDKLVNELGLIEAPNMTIVDNSTTYYLKGIDKTPKAGVTHWTAPKEENYLIVELKAPNGFIKSNEAYKISNSNFEHEQITVPIVNEALVYEIPSSGGIGVGIIYVLGGIIFMATFVLLVVKLRMKFRSEN